MTRSGVPWGLPVQMKLDGVLCHRQNNLNGFLSRWKSDIQEVWVSDRFILGGKNRKIQSERAFCLVFRCVICLGSGKSIYPLCWTATRLYRLRRLSRNMWCRLGAIPRCSCRFYEVRTRPHEVRFWWQYVKVTECEISQMCIPERSFATRSCTYLWCICNHLTLQKSCRLVAIKLSVSPAKMNHIGELKRGDPTDQRRNITVRPLWNAGLIKIQK
jgi:hypothetical protein